MSYADRRLRRSGSGDSAAGLCAPGHGLARRAEALGFRRDIATGSPTHVPERWPASDAFLQASNSSRAFMTIRESESVQRGGPSGRWRSDELAGRCRAPACPQGDLEASPVRRRPEAPRRPMDALGASWGRLAPAHADARPLTGRRRCCRYNVCPHASRRTPGRWSRPAWATGGAGVGGEPRPSRRARRAPRPDRTRAGDAAPLAPRLARGPAACPSAGGGDAARPRRRGGSAMS